MVMIENNQVVTLLVCAIKDGERVQLIDCQGQTLTGMIDRKRLGRLSKRSPAESAWLQAVRRQIGRLNTRFKSNANECPWFRKCKSLAASFRLRGLDLGRPKSRRRFDCYLTKTWEDASVRLWRQGNNRHRRIQRTGWDRWATTVANNHNKRKGGRYAKS